MRKLSIGTAITVVLLAGCNKQPNNSSTNTVAPPIEAPNGPPEGAIKTADGHPVKVLQQAEVGATLQQAPPDIMPSKIFVVDGNKSFDGWYLAADKIEFKPGATLTFSRQAVEARRNFFLIAREIVQDDPGRPGTITYVAPPVSPAAPTAGQGATGPHAGGGGGAPGGPGADGLIGNNGTTGFDAPNLTVITLDIPGSGPIVDFKGGVGGQGGQGQQGGDGGNGAVGVPASENMFNCKHGAGTGGSGGSGGNGGQGGPGGTGGAGGSVTVMAPSDKLPSMLQKFRVLTSGGTYGQGGLSGKGGNGGRGGQGGAQSLPYCKGDGGTGRDGPQGNPGKPGDAGKAGLDGDVFVGSITDAEFDHIYGH